MTWRSALLAAAKDRRRRDLFRSLFIATPAVVIGSLDRSIIIGLLLGAWMFVATYAADIVDAARRSRKHARQEQADGA